MGNDKQIWLGVMHYQSELQKLTNIDFDKYKPQKDFIITKPIKWENNFTKMEQSMITIETIRATKDLIKWKTILVDLGIEYTQIYKRKALTTTESENIENYLKQKGIELSSK